MKKAFTAFSFAVLCLMVVFSCAKGYESQKSAGDLKVTLLVERYPLVKGDNSLNVKVADAAGKAITDATVCRAVLHAAHARHGAHGISKHRQ